MGGRVTGVLFDAAEQHVLGLEVTGSDLARRFLPWVAATSGDGGLVIGSPMLLVESCDAYLERGAVLVRDAEAFGILLSRLHSRDVSTGLVAGMEPT